MSNLTVMNTNGRLVVDSREVAAMTNKDHDKLLRDIRNYISQMNQANEESPDLESPKINPNDYFIESTYINSQNKEQPCFLLTKIGCDFVANKMTGVKGTAFTAAYTKKFEEMEKSLGLAFKGLSKELQAIFVLDARTVELEGRVEKIENTMTIDYGQQLELKSIAQARAIKAMGGMLSASYKNSSLRGKVFSAVWKDYKDYFDVNSYKNTARKDFERAKEYLRGWQAQGKLLREIEDCNRQLEIEREAM